MDTRHCGEYKTPTLVNASCVYLSNSYLTLHFDVKLPEQVLQFTLKRAHVLEDEEKKKEKKR